MTTNTKIITEDVLSILDVKIHTSSAHAQLNVASGETYDSVLAKIAARSPTLNEKGALDAAVSPSAGNPYVTFSELITTLTGAIPWQTIGPIGSGANFEGSDEAPFLAAFATVPTYSWFYVMPATYTFAVPVTVPDEIRLVGGVTSETLLVSNTGSVLTLGQNTYVSFLSIVTTLSAATAINAASSISIGLDNCIIASPSDGITVDVTGASNLTMSDCALILGNLTGLGLSVSNIANLYVDASGNYGIDLDSPDDVIIWGSVFYAGTPRITSAVNTRVVGNHFNNGVSNVTPGSSVMLRANTPTSNNNEDDELTYLLQYLGSPSVTQATPSYSSNFAGPQAQDLTARASAIDLLLQWIYEERNFSLIAQTEPMTVTWNPTANTLSTSGNMLLVSAHRDAVWILSTLVATVIPTGWFLYYIIDRSLSTANITLTPLLAPLGSLPLDTNPPTGSASQRQIWILAYNLSGTLWWRGGGGSRFPSTGGTVGQYFVDGTSKNLLTYLGSSDYNDSTPIYSNNFAGIQNESLTTRLSKVDTLLQRLFEYSNLSYFLSFGGYISSDIVGSLTLTGTLTFRLPHTTSTITVAANTWVIPDGSLLYFTWDQTTYGAASSTVATSVPLPNAYPLTTKYFVAAIRIGSMFYLWDGSRIPMNGGRWPLISSSRSVIPTALPSSLAYNTVATSTGIALTRNTLVNQTTPSVGLTNLADGQGLMITHTWNTGAAQNVLIQQVNLPLTSILEQNQFIWVQNRGGYLLFTGEF
jgi:hypothetical protein